MPLHSMARTKKRKSILIHTQVIHHLHPHHPLHLLLLHNLGLKNQNQRILSVQWESLIRLIKMQMVWWALKSLRTISINNKYRRRRRSKTGLRKSISIKMAILAGKSLRNSRMKMIPKSPQRRNEVIQWLKI